MSVCSKFLVYAKMRIDNIKVKPIDAAVSLLES